MFCYTYLLQMHYKCLKKCVVRQQWKKWQDTHDINILMMGMKQLLSSAWQCTCTLVSGGKKVPHQAHCNGFTASGIPFPLGSQTASGLSCCNSQLNACLQNPLSTQNSDSTQTTWLSDSQAWAISHHPSTPLIAVSGLFYNASQSPLNMDLAITAHTMPLLTAILLLSVHLLQPLPATGYVRRAIP